MEKAVYSFADCELDTGLYQLRRGGELVKVEPRVFDVLLYLLERRDRVVTKSELLGALWPDSISESVLPRCIAAARRALGDDTSAERIIQTVRGRGYRFVADAAPAGSQSTPSAKDRDRAEPPPAPKRVFVGRTSAMASLRSALADTFSGRGRLVILVGEPGIGKTRTAEEIAREAAGRGALVWTGRGYDGEGAPRLWPWVQILRAALAGPDSSRSPEDAGGAASEVTELLPELARDARSSMGAATFAAGRARSHLFAGVAGLLRQRSEAQPIVIVLDDLHWADETSVILMRHVTREIVDARILLVGTFRDVDADLSHPVPDALRRLAAEPNYTRVDLHGLARRDIARFIEAKTGLAPSRSVLEAVHHMTDGNPFFVEEIVRLLVEDGNLDGAVAAGALALPRGVREAVARRIEGMPREQADLLELASVAGERFSPRILALASGIGSERALELLDASVSAGLLRPVARGSLEYTFVHALTREALYEGLPTPKRIRHHKAIGESLERLYGHVGPARLATLAHHFYRALPLGDADKAVDYEIRAAEQACDARHFEEGTAHYAHALQALDVRVPADDRRRCDVMLALAETLFRSGERSRARHLYMQSAELARSSDQPRQLARAALGFGERAEFGMPRDDLLLALLEDALSRLGSRDDGLRARVLARLAVAAPNSESVEVRTRLSAEALSLARSHGEPATVMMALAARIWTLMGPDAAKDRVELSDELLHTAKKLGDENMAYQALELRSAARMTLGDRDGADRDLDAIAELAKALQDPVDRWYWGWFVASRALTDGRYEDAERLIEAGVAAGERAEHPGAALLAGGQALWLALERGDLDRYVQGLSTMVAHYPWADRLCEIASMFRNARRQQLRSASAELGRFAHRGFAEIPRDEHWLPAMTQIAWTCSILGDRPRAEQLFELLEPFSELNAFHELIRVSAGAVSLYLGMLARTLGWWDRAAELLDRALAQNEKMRARPYVVRTLVEHAAMLSARAGDDDVARARHTLVRAASLASELGVESVVAETREALDRLPRGA